VKLGKGRRDTNEIKEMEVEGANQQDVRKAKDYKVGKKRLINRRKAKKKMT
jgi:hypothetical protein